MKKTLLFISIALISIAKLSAQEKSANEILKQYGFSPENVLSFINLSNAPYNFSAQSSTTTMIESNQSTTRSQKQYTYDAGKKAGEKYSLVSVDGDTPRKKDIKHFDKEKNSVDNKKTQMLTAKDFFVKSNDENTAIIGFNIPDKQLNSKTAFMAHCTGFIYIDKKSGHINKIQISNNEAFNLKVFHVTEMVLDVNIAYNTEHKQYYVSSEKTIMKVLILGSITDFNIEEKYSNFVFN
jgi:hypothetical protein